MTFKKQVMKNDLKMILKIKVITVSVFIIMMIIYNFN